MREGCSGRMEKTGQSPSRLTAAVPRDTSRTFTRHQAVYKTVHTIYVYKHITPKCHPLDEPMNERISSFPGWEAKTCVAGLT